MPTRPDFLDIVHHGVVWSFVGALYAALFVPVFEIVRTLLPLWTAPVFATLAASIGGAMVYSSAQLALLVAIATNVILVATLIFAGEVGSPLLPVAIGIVSGGLVGAVYGHAVKASRIYCADAKLLAAATVGLAGSAISAAWILVFDAGITLLVAVLAPLTGIFYERIVDNYIRRFSDLLPPVADGGVAGAAIGGFIACGLWTMAGSVSVLNITAPAWQGTIVSIVDTLPAAVATAAAATLIVGMLRAAFR